MAAAGAISGTGSGITALLRLRRPAARHPSVAACSLADGGNPICGRHLRPSLIHLDRSFPPSRIPAAVSKKGGLLRPVAPAAAASSSPAEGSYYVGFVSVIHLFVGVVYCLLEGPQLMQHGFKDAIAKVGMTKFLSDLFWVGMFYHLYNQVTV
ncbi:hypothetical protein BHE74_00004707 [Ensete ventricosum]|nr:hypothetical protein GW17_00013440 [Ensete ventricosum]RWW86516.1 hypothetical protein BHE74_00004707 [Ensete ventricosum]RZS16380.1 hypothetical protein BHM03_00048362 [Ensete ventricosum]